MNVTDNRQHIANVKNFRLEPPPSVDRPIFYFRRGSIMN